jgi:general secretion pathway protein C
VSQGFNHNHTMMTAPNSIWFPRSLTFVVWALAAASAVFWGLRWDGKAALTQPIATLAPSATVAEAGAVARLLGSAGVVAAVAVNAPNRLVLAGVVARTGSHTGAALIAIDGKPAKSISVGARVEEGLFLRSVQGRQASLAASPDGPVTMTLELPPASLTSPGNPGAAQSVAAPAPAQPVAPSVPAPGAQPVDLEAAPRVLVSPPIPSAAPPSGRRVRSARTSDTQD